MKFLKNIIERKLGSLAYYRKVDESITMDLSLCISLSLEEEIFGIYYNKPYEIFDSIVVTNKGIHILNSDQEYLKFDYLDIEMIKFPPKNIHSTSLDVHLKSGSVVQVHVKHINNNRNYDVYTFGNYLRGIVGYMEYWRDHKEGIN